MVSNRRIVTADGPDFYPTPEWGRHMIESPFIPGARVAVSERYGTGVTEGFVDKVYKNGRFTLRGSKQQWRPWCHTWNDANRWSATETGNSWSRQRLDLWDETTDKELSERLEAERTKARWRDLQSRVHNMRHPTAALCDAVEAALTSRK